MGIFKMLKNLMLLSLFYDKRLTILYHCVSKIVATNNSQRVLETKSKGNWYKGDIKTHYIKEYPDVTYSLKMYQQK